jgi:cyclic-di-AMP phosphodiesterase PgpH
MLSFPQSVMQKSRRFLIFRAIVLVATGLLAIFILNAPISIRSGIIPHAIGEVAAQDIQSPKAISYESKVLTDQAKLQASQSVSPVYLPSDPSVKRQQLDILRVNLQFVSQIRQDPYASREQKVNDLSHMNDMQLSPTTVQKILDLSDSRWQDIQSESEKILEVLFRSTIRETNIAEIKNDIPSLVDASFQQSLAGIVSEVVSQFVVPNSIFSQELTDKARSDAQTKVEPVTRKYEIGQIIIRHGQVIRAEDLEALQAIGLVDTQFSINTILSSSALVIVLMVFVALYGLRRQTSPMDDLRSLLLISFTFLFFLILGRLIIPYRTVVPFIFPAAAFGLTLATAFSLETGLIFSMILSLLVAYGLPGSLEITMFYLVGSFCGILVLGRGRNIGSFFRASISMSATNALVIMAYRLSDPVTDWIGLATLIGASIVNGFAAASVTLILQFIYSQSLGITTALQLLDISRPDHPLLQFMLRNSPGTYQHSLQVANLAEQAAEAINADSLLVRVGALYHDAGKAMNPQFFIENQIKGNPNPHEGLDPLTSAGVIVKHIGDGVALARKYNLPPRLQDFIREHHGTLITRYQYNRAVTENGNDESKVDIEAYRYPGPSPRSRETALLMLADGCEARARAELPKDEIELRSMVKKVIDKCLIDGQLDNTRLTLNDLVKITDSFTTTLMGVYHQRIIYPELQPKDNLKQLDGSTQIHQPENRDAANPN